MIEILKTTDTAVAFKSSVELTADDYKTVIAPAVKSLSEKFNEINFLFFIDGEFPDFIMPVWVEDALIGLRNFGKWNRTAIVTNSQKVQSFARSFSFIVSGELRTYSKDRLKEALLWVSGNEIQYFDNSPSYSDADDLGEKNFSNGYTDLDLRKFD
ncbi:hypothetical protein ASE40_05460 [Flavobacterium sp. Root935]|uniref:STAS/SEC14 domain-containing protein n=1 Tax=Flavobacterium sp. Root935 TaxID=1736610 RepID=UPI00070F2195|nr:STAS/SEC14 domain-containing protein [Flavobacterium sp. Root935]KRD61004.1 hypothetical protein ASE40_05460 [Flavobacterium sp. Root935]